MPEAVQHIARKIPAEQRLENRVRAMEKELGSLRTARERELKAHLHITCVCIGGILAVIITFIPYFDPLTHIVPALPFAPSVVQEILDRLIGL